MKEINSKSNYAQGTGEYVDPDIVLQVLSIVSQSRFTKKANVQSGPQASFSKFSVCS